MSNSVIYGAVALGDPTSLRVADLRAVVLPQITALIELACANDVKQRLKAPFEDTLEDLTRFSTLVAALAREKKLIALVTVVGPDATVDRFHQVASEFLARIVTRFSDLKLAPGQGTVVLPKMTAKAAKAAAAVPATVLWAPMTRWIAAAAGLIFLVLVESLMAFFQKPATLDEANKLSIANAQAHLRRDVTEEELAISAALTIMRRQADHRLMLPMLPDAVCVQVFAADLVAHLPVSIKSKVAVFDDAARMAVPALDSFEARMGTSAHQPACIAQLGAWAATIKAEKAEFKKAVQQQVAALAAVPPSHEAPPVAAPPPGARPQRHQRNNLDFCLCCDKAGRPTGHARETCQHYRCFGCGVKAPGHLYRNCPNPVLGGPCPPHGQ